MILYLCKNQTAMKIEINGTPLEFAKNSSASDLKKLIKACKKGDYDEWLDRCRICFEEYLAGNMDKARWWSNHAELVRPE